MRPGSCHDDEVLQLNKLDLQQLRHLWSKRFGPTPKLRSVELLRLMIAWRLQSKNHVGLDHETRRALLRKTPLEAEGHHLGNGAVLRRIWQGAAIEAVVEEGGFRCRDKLYPSLSAIAEATTGTRWNGPRFFGLRKAKP